MGDFYEQCVEICPMICRRVFGTDFYCFESVEVVEHAGRVPRAKSFYWVLQRGVSGTRSRPSRNSRPFDSRWEQLVDWILQNTDIDFDETNAILVWVCVSQKQSKELFKTNIGFEMKQIHTNWMFWKQNWKKGFKLTLIGHAGLHFILALLHCCLSPTRHIAYSFSFLVFLCFLFFPFPIYT